MRKQTNHWQIAHSPTFLEMVNRRRRVTRVLSYLVLGSFAVFVGLAMFWPTVLTLSIPGTELTVGVVFTFYILLLGVVSSGFYTLWANTRFDKMQRQVVKEFESSQHDS